VSPAERETQERAMAARLVANYGVTPDQARAIARDTTATLVKTVDAAFEAGRADGAKRAMELRALADGALAPFRPNPARALDVLFGGSVALLLLIALVGWAVAR
jgi:hypothetical protein